MGRRAGRPRHVPRHAGGLPLIALLLVALGSTAAHAFPNPIADRGTTEIWIGTPGATRSRLVAVVDVCQITTSSGTRELERWVTFAGADNALYGDWAGTGMLPESLLAAPLRVRTAPYQAVWYDSAIPPQRKSGAACSLAPTQDAFAVQWQTVVENYYGDKCSAGAALCNPSSPYDCSDAGGDDCRGAITPIDRASMSFWSGCHDAWQDLSASDPHEDYHKGIWPFWSYRKRVDQFTCGNNPDFDAITYGEWYDADHTPFRAHQVRVQGQSCSSASVDYGHHADNGAKKLSQVIDGLDASKTWEYSWGVAVRAAVDFPNLPPGCQ